MRSSLYRAVVCCVLATAFAASAATPGYAGWCWGPGYGWQCAPYGGWYGDWRSVGVVLAVPLSPSYGYNFGGCMTYQPVYDQWGNVIGRQPTYFC
ncbi:MAG TPA: hypothetical protein VGY52_00955 [Roseiarcus sp.]|jgi:hypothetical protein|nr:hypothetical protein [Roseiarcus sp.]